MKAQKGSRVIALLFL